MGGFPNWTLLGMGISAGLAVLFSALAFLAQSPSLLTRFRLAGSDFSQNSRRLTGLGLACTLLGMGFFMAGVPIGEQAIAQQVDQSTAAVQPETSAAADSSESDVSAIAQIADDAETAPQTESASGGFGAPAQTTEDEGASDASGQEVTPTAASGAFSAPAQSDEENASDEAGEPAESASDSDEVAVADGESATATAEPTQAIVEPTASPTNTPAPTATPSPIPTATPTPTITPTAVNVDTISVTFDGSVTWVYRVPGNNRLELVNNGDALLLESGRAMVQGVTWQEIRLLDGRSGWIQLSLLDLGEEE